MAEFGWWFSSGVLDEDWSLQQLERVLKSARYVEANTFVVERLAEVSDGRPREAVTILGLMASGELGPWTVSMWRSAGRAILEVALRAGGDAAVEAARVINLLAARGHMQYVDLLRKS
jgi:hypothetical protein